jgi:hypothetical protein
MSALPLTRYIQTSGFALDLLHHHIALGLGHEGGEHGAFAVELNGALERLGGFERIGHALDLGFRGCIGLGMGETAHGKDGGGDGNESGWQHDRESPITAACAAERGDFGGRE